MDNRKKIILGGVSLLISVGVLIGATLLVRYRQTIRTKATTSQVGISLSAPTTITTTTGQSFDVGLTVNPNTLSVSAIQAYLNYDPQKLTLISLTTNDFFKRNYPPAGTLGLEILDKNTAGVAKITAGALCTTTAPWACYPQNSAGILATLRFQANAGQTGNTQVGFDSGNTAVAAIGQTTNVADSGNLTPTTMTINPTTITANLSFKVGLQGASPAHHPDKSVRVILKQSGTIKQQFDNVAVTADAGGIYAGQLTGITPGTYDILVKSNGFLQKKFSAINLAAGNNSQDWSTRPLLAGDFNGDNRLTIIDVSSILSVYTSLSTPATGSKAIYDVDNNGVINILDISLILGNYTSLTVSGDN